AAAYDVETTSFASQGAEHGAVRIGFDGETDQVLDAAHSAVQFSKMFGQGALRVDVKRRAEFAGEPFDRNPFAIERVPDVMKIMHRAGIVVREERRQKSKMGAGTARPRSIKVRKRGFRRHGDEAVSAPHLDYARLNGVDDLVAGGNRTDNHGVMLGNQP